MNIVPILDPIRKLRYIEGVSFTWKDSSEKSIGLIAQNVEQVYPELAFTDGNGMKSVDYSKLVAPLIEAVKSQQKQIDDLKEHIESSKILV